MPSTIADLKPLRLRWTKTWDHKPNDFMAVVPTGSCRIYKTHQGDYYWCANGDTKMLGSGHEPTAREAALAAERCWVEEFGEPEG